MKKVMIVGAGASQVPLIQHCKNLGLFTIVISPFGPYPGIAMADKHIDEDIFNRDSLVEIGKVEGIDYVISDQSDYAVPIVAYVADKLGLPGNSTEVAETYTYKSKFRRFCQENGIPAPKAVVIDISDPDYSLISDLRFPVVIKPADSQGSRGISKVMESSGIEDALENASRYTRGNQVVVEEYFQGREIVCEGFVINGVYYNVAFGDREYFNLDGLFIPSKTKFPAYLSDSAKEKLIANEKKIASKLNTSFGIVHSEYLINENDEFIVIESALRGGGVYIASHLIPLSTGIDLTKVLVSAMKGKYDECIEMLHPSDKGAAEYLCFYLKEGNVSSVKGREALADNPDVVIAEIDNISEGDRIARFEHKGMRKGPFIIKGKDMKAVSSTEAFIKSILSIEVDEKPGIVWQ